MNLNEEISKYIRFCAEQKTLSPKTTKAYRTDLCQFSEHSRNAFDREHIRSYIIHLHKRFKPKTAKRKIAALKAFTHYLMVQDIISENPFNKIDVSFREPVMLPKTIPFGIINAILRSAYNELQLCNTEHSRKCAMRDVAVLEILFATGARVSEICSLTPEALDLNNHTMKIFGKGSKERMIQIENPDVLKALQNYQSVFSSGISESGYFFVNKLGNRLSEQSVRAMINRYAAAVGYERHITPHMFRHSFATLLLEEDVDIRYIQKILGHSSITTTQIYTHVAMAKQKEILTIKHPRNKIKL
mgnify:CR=1 FL=1